MQQIDRDSTTAGRSDVAVDAGRTALVIVDMQNCFVADSPAGSARPAPKKCNAPPAR